MGCSVYIVFVLLYKDITLKNAAAPAMSGYLL